MVRSIEIEKYDFKWEEVFKELKSVLETEISFPLESIEHIGSTSVKGLSAKPIIDLDIVIKNDELFPRVIKELEKLGYYYEGDLGIVGREAFARRDHKVPWDGSGKVWMEHHLYVCSKENQELKRHIAFRDYLRENPDAAAEYEVLKKKLSISSIDRSAYTEAKGEFINSILKKMYRKN